MEFIAIPVKKGDSFLLNDNEFSLLVDGGDGQTKIINYIREHTDHLDVVICTHYDGDHVKGLLNLFEYVFSYERIMRHKIRANKKGLSSNVLDNIIKVLLSESEGLVTFDEIWLPDVFGRIALFKRQQAAGIIISKDIDKVRVLMGDKREYEEEIYRNREGFDMVINTICRLVRYCYRLVEYYGVRIRWFTYVNEMKNEHIDYNIYAINCEELDRKIKPYSSEEEMIFEFTKINEESLVFRYNEAKEGSTLPNVLFTADSNFAFYGGREVPLNNTVSIVTVPHHGSRDDEHKKVYENLGDKEFVFVRSSERNEKRPSEEYKRHPSSKKYCTRCGKKGRAEDEQEIHLEFKFEEKIWKAVNDVKTCTCNERDEQSLTK